MYKLFNNQRGQLFILSLIVVTLVMVNSVLIINNALTTRTSSNYSSSEVQAINLAEAGVDKAVEGLNRTAGGYNGEPETTLGDGTFSVTVTSVDASNKYIEATGYIPNKANAKVKRSIRIQVVKGSGAAFSYALQAGEGGMDISGGSRVNGSVYANNSIALSGGGTITGDAVVAGGLQADQSVDCSSTNCQDYQFGKVVGGQSIIDVAQSFQPSAANTLNKVVVKLKKVGNPSNLSVKILGDSSGQPNKNNVLASGTIDSSRVTTAYGFIDVNLSSAPTLSANTTYWIVMDASSNTNNYYAWSGDIAQSYNRGKAMWSANWQATSPVWTNSNVDLGFQSYMGGVPTSIAVQGNATIGGSAYANTISTNASFTIGQHAYYQLMNGSVSVHGSTCNASNTYCHPNSPDPVPKPLPISDANIQAWKDAATAAGVRTGDINMSFPCSNLTAGKIVGNVTLGGGCTVNMIDPVWITGNLTVSNGAKLRLDSSYGAASGVVIADGQINFSGGGQVLGSGTTNSYLTAISTYDSRTNGVAAINLNGGSSSSIIYAGKGIINMTGGTNLRELSAWRVVLSGGATITYDSGLEGLTYFTGPSGEYTPVKGTYKIK